MKKSELIVFRIVQGTVFMLGLVLAIAFTYTIVQAASGNIRSTACFEF